MLKRKLPARITAGLDEIRAQIGQAKMHHRKGRPYYWAIGKAWGPIKTDPIVDELGGLEALKPYLPVSIQWLNRCLVASDGHETGDLERGERYAEQVGYHPRNSEEPYLMAEMTELWRTKKPPRRRQTFPLAMIAGKLFVRSEVVKFPHGTAVLGDCHRLIKEVSDGLIDAVINNPPFGIWGVASHGHVGKILHSWDQPLDWNNLWPELWRVLKPTGNVAICAAQPLASTLIARQLKNFLYCNYWLRKATNIYGPKNGRPMNVIEPIPVFSQAGHHERTYNPQMRDLGEIVDRLREPWRRRLFEPLLSELEAHSRHMRYRSLAPVDLIMAERTAFDFPRIQHGQKPVGLMRTLVRTLSNPGDVILDISAGSMTTAVAAALEGRRFVSFEQHRPHFVLGTQRLSRLYAAKKFPDL
jgi:site-specific DNA-methyltransferase (adenine-specific)